MMLGALDNLKIQQKLTFAFGGIVAAIVAMSLCVYFGVSGLENVRRDIERAKLAQDAAVHAQMYMARQDAALRAYVMSRIPSAIDAVSVHRSGFNDSLDEYIRLQPNSQAEVDAARASVENWFEAVAVRGVGLTNLADYDNAGLLEPVDAALQKLVDARVAEAEALSRRQVVLANMMRIVMGVGTVLALGMAVACGFWLTRGVSRPLRAVANATRKLVKGDTQVSIPALGRTDEVGLMASAVEHFRQVTIEQNALKARNEAMQKEAEAARLRREAELEQSRRNDALVVGALAEGLEAMARGDLTWRITADFPETAVTLKTDFNAAIESLEKAVSLVNANVSVIHLGAEEISAASNDLSNRTEQQAATLEQTAAALDQITATVGRTADGAKEAASVVLSTRTDAQRSGVVMTNAVEAMNAIEESSKRIGAIIGVIDEIAFQTNLLALNAGVEAARAGDAGRGFAVVASEVRALAQRSADAAKEIKALISESGQQVSQGVNLVGQTGDALSRIVDRVAQIDSLVNEIAASAQEQAIGLAQVNAAVNQMDQVTQQNAAMVEESTAACQALAAEAEDLARSVSRFVVNQQLARTTKAIRPQVAAPVAPAAP
ncbi:methyl-accepting chemotaxis protein, partial [uncultured Brevundimonas sp.]|uniref:methyl-accepting chemotaxis protein n=1 Tax=uncultured Brevundimonas sp. TaxID=213418 RepID=UPI0026226241